MKNISYTLTGIDDTGNVVLDIPIEVAIAGAIVLNEIAEKRATVAKENIRIRVVDEEDPKPFVRRPKKEKPEPPAAKKQRKPRVVTCKNCGKTGHFTSTCKNESIAQEEVTSKKPTWATLRVREMLQEGRTLEEVAAEVKLNVNVVEHMKQKLIRDGELDA